MKSDEETRAREEAEQTLGSFRKASAVDLERRLESLMDEIVFLRKVHDEEIQELSSMSLWSWSSPSRTSPRP